MFLSEPNDESGANVDASKMWRDDREKFYKIARELVKKSLSMWRMDYTDQCDKRTLVNCYQEIMDFALMPFIFAQLWISFSICKMIFMCTHHWLIPRWWKCGIVTFLFAVIKVKWEIIRKYLKGKFSSGIEGALASTLNHDFNWKQLSEMILCIFLLMFSKFIWVTLIQKQRKYK